jgi:hypothetical protein
VGLWGELRARHEEVSAIACENLAEHARAIEKRESRVQVQARAPEPRRRRPAAPTPSVVAASDAAVSED